MPKNEKPGQAADWGLATWDGSRREALRRRAQLPHERLIAALEEMQELSDMLAKSPAGGEATSQPGAESAVHEQPDLPARRAQAGDYTAKAETQPLSSRDATLPATADRVNRTKKAAMGNKKNLDNIAMAGNRPKPSRRQA